MVSLRSLLLAFSLRLLTLLPGYLCLLGLVEPQNRSDEVQILSDLEFWTVGDGNRGSGGRLSVIEPSGYWSSWKKTDDNPCAWVGVTCTANFTVEQLDLSGWGLTSLTTLEMLSSLRDLRQLDLSSNDLDAEIPDDVGTLTQITRLDLSRNSFSGNIPPNISLCGNLRYLNLGQNNLEGQIPSLSGLTNVQVLFLGGNLLSGPFPRELGNITGLVSIDLSGNSLDGSIPSLSSLTGLLNLRLDDNNFTDFEQPGYPAPIGLKHLFVSGNQLEHGIPPGMTNMLNLEVLNMSRNRLSGEIPFGLGRQWNHSFWLDLSQNNLTGNIPSDLLQSTGYSQVAFVNLSHNNLTGNIPISLDGGVDMFYDVLDLSHNQLSGPIPSFFKNVSLIYSLWLQNNLLSGDIVDFILANLNGLAFTYELRLENNMLTGDLSRMAHNWGNVTSVIEVVNLSNNKLQMRTTKAIPDPVRITLESFINGYGNWIEFRVGGNNFSGTSLPAAYLSGANPLEVLDLSNCHLDGEISGAVFNSTWLPALQYLNLSNNDATGPIPESIIMLQNLSILDVSMNNLSGQLPFIPPSSNLRNPSFFAGNAALCGDPLPPCSSNSTVFIVQPGTGIKWWVLLVIICGCVITIVGSCLVATWRLRAYRKRHEQDVDLIKTLKERDSATLMSLRELRKATENFAESAQIGEGGFGTVYAGKLDDGTRVAIKRSKREGSEKDKQQFLNEVRILSQVSHRNLVKLLGCCMENKVALLVFEFISNGTLQEHLQGKTGAVLLTWKQRLTIAVQTADALNYLHCAATFPIYHRDVKSANILLNDDLNAKVADFGISKLAAVGDATHLSTAAVQGTFGYIDPEYFATLQLTGKSDVYSFGVVLLELISAKPAIDFLRGGEDTSLVNFAGPLVNKGELQQLIDPALIKTYSDATGRDSILNVGKLAMRCLDMRSKARPSMNEVWIELQNLWMEFDGISRPFAQEDCDKGFLQFFPNSHAFPLDSVSHDGAPAIEIVNVPSRF